MEADGSPLTGREDGCTRLGAPLHPHLEGGFVPASQLLYNNAPEPFPFDNENCRGYFLPLHRPTYDKRLDASCNFPYGDHFRGKRRIWEMRFQLSFKRPLNGAEFYFGVELEQYVPLSSSTKRVMDVTVATLRQIVGDALYHSLGDDPTKVPGELEQPAFMMPLWAFDQCIVTPEGEEPPSLSDPNIDSLGEKRAGRVREYRRTMDALELRVGPTYTFCFWGISRYFDVIHWRVQGIPVLTPLDLNQYCGSPPIYLAFYTLPKRPDGDKDRRHLPSRKNYYLRLGFWSSEKRPSWDVINSFVKYDVLEDSPTIGARGNGAARGKVGDLASLLGCCYNRSYDRSEEN